MNETRQLAEFIVGFKNDDLTDELIEKTKRHILDQMGCQTAFATLPWGKSVYQYARMRNSIGASTISYYGLKTAPEDAAFVNGVFGHGFEMDDDDESTTSHPGVAIVPAALAVGEDQVVTGRDLITSIVLGYDTMIRVGLASRNMHGHFFHETPTLGTFGATAAACKLHGLTVEQTMNAFGIATSESCGITEYSSTGGSIKRVHAGLGASNGVRAALLAKAGITGPTEAFEGKKGWLAAFAGPENDPSKIVENLGSDFKIMKVGMKPYCCCAGIHGVIDAAEKIRAKGVLPEDIAELKLMMRPRESGDVGLIIEPQDVVSAQFSARFGAALRLVKGGNGFRDYVMDNVNDQVVRELARNVVWEIDEDDTYLSGTAAPARVTVTLKNGTVYQEQVNNATGTLGNPMEWDEVVEKYKGLVQGVISQNQCDNAIEQVSSLENLIEIGVLTKLTIPNGMK